MRLSLFIAVTVVSTLSNVQQTKCLFAQTASQHSDGPIRGVSQPIRRSQVATALGGTVEALFVREGVYVDKGACLVKLDSGLHEQRLEQARVAKDSVGDLKFAQALLHAKQLRLQQIRLLVDSNQASPVELLRAEEESALAEANIEIVRDRQLQHEADYQRLRIEVEQHCVVAPFAGLVVGVKKEVGEYVGPEDAAVCDLVDISQLTVDFDVPRSVWEKLWVDRPMTVYFPSAQKTVMGSVWSISPIPEGARETFAISLRVENATGELSAGERCELWDDSPALNAEAVPSSVELTVLRRR